MDFNYYWQIESISPHPVLFTVGTEAATLFMSKAGYERAKQPKDWFEIQGATHHRLYDDEAAVGKAVAKLEEFFGRNLSASPDHSAVERADWCRVSAEWQADLRRDSSSFKAMEATKV